MRAQTVELVAGIIDRIENRRPGPGRPPVPTAEVIRTLGFLVREGVQWRELKAAAGRASGSTLRRRLDAWHTTAVLRRVYAVLVRMARSGPNTTASEVVVDSCSVRAKRGGELTGPNPTDRGKPGTKYHMVVSTDGLPLAVLPSAANVHDTKLFPDLLRLAQVVCAAIGKLFADAGYDSADTRWLCLRDGIQPHIRKIGEPHGSGLGKVRCVVEHGCPRLLANNRLDRRQGPRPAEGPRGRMSGRVFEPVACGRRRARVSRAHRVGPCGRRERIGGDPAVPAPSSVAFARTAQVSKPAGATLPRMWSGRMRTEKGP